MIKRIKIMAVLTACALLAACGQPNVSKLLSTDKIVVIGDDITVGTGGKGTNFPAEMGTMIGHWVVNAGVPDETSITAKGKLEQLLLKEMPSHLMIAVGGVDMKNGVDDSIIQGNIDEMIKTAKLNNIVPIVVGVPRPATPGSNLNLADASFYQEVANKNDVVYIKNAISKMLDTPAYRSSPTLLTADGYIKLAEEIAKQMKEAGFVQNLKGVKED